MKESKFVYVTGYGLVEFIPQEEKVHEGFPQLRGSIVLPKNCYTYKGGQAMELDYWFSENQVFDSPVEALDKMAERFEVGELV